MELQRVRAKTEVPKASTDRKELALNKLLNQNPRAVWVLGFGPALPGRARGLRRQAGRSPETARKSKVLYSFASSGS